MDIQASGDVEQRLSDAFVSLNERCNVIIVGGGFAGAALAYHLLRRRSSGLQVTLIERGAQLGRGLAYGARSPVLRLNVPAARMSLDPQRPDDFVKFAGSQAAPGAFLPRRVYGAYVEARLSELQRRDPERLRVVRGEVVWLDGHGVSLADGRNLRGDRVVVASGVAARRSACSWPQDERIADAWDEAACSRLAQGRTLLVGTGLSALDAFGLLDAAGHDSQIVLLSRHGLLPRPHAAHSGRFEVPARLGPSPADLRGLLRWGRAVLNEAQRSGCAWQHGIDALRPQLPKLWQALSVRDRTRFVRLVRPYWEVLRHRAPIDALERIEARRAQGRLHILAGSVVDCRAHAAGLDVTLRLRGGAQRIERFQSVIRCLGPALECDPTSSPLVAALLGQGLAQLDPSRLGITTGDRGRLIDAAGRPSDRLFALGQLCRASRWETTSVPEIVRDAEALAELFADRARNGTAEIRSLDGLTHPENGTLSPERS